MWRPAQVTKLGRYCVEERRHLAITRSFWPRFTVNLRLQLSFTCPQRSLFLFSSVTSSEFCRLPSVFVISYASPNVMCFSEYKPGPHWVSQNDQSVLSQLENDSYYIRGGGKMHPLGMGALPRTRKCPIVMVRPVLFPAEIQSYRFPLGGDLPVLPPPELPRPPFPGLRCTHTHLCYIPDHVFCYSTDFLDQCRHYFHYEIPVHASGGQKFAQKEWVFSLHFSLLTEMIYSRRIEV